MLYAALLISGNRLNWFSISAVSLTLSDIFICKKLIFIKRICLLVSHSVMMECVNLYVLSKEFSDLKSLYAVDFMKMSSSGIRDIVYDAFAGLCFGET